MDKIIFHSTVVDDSEFGMSEDIQTIHFEVGECSLDRLMANFLKFCLAIGYASKSIESEVIRIANHCQDGASIEDIIFV